jgi:hypothetical protein
MTPRADSGAKQSSSSWPLPEAFSWKSPLGYVLNAGSRRGVRMDRVRFITHQGKQILLVDLTDCAAEEVIELLTQVQHIVTTQPRNSVLTLCDLTGTEFSRAAVTRMKEVAVFDRPYVNSACGCRESTQSLLRRAEDLFRREFLRFKTREEAMDCLVREDGGGEMSFDDRTSPGRLGNAAWTRHRGAA